MPVDPFRPPAECLLKTEELQVARALRGLRDRQAAGQQNQFATLHLSQRRGVLIGLRKWKVERRRTQCKDVLVRAELRSDEG
jgi:hypothetical protein